MNAVTLDLLTISSARSRGITGITRPLIVSKVMSSGVIPNSALARSTPLSVPGRSHSDIVNKSSKSARLYASTSGVDGYPGVTPKRPMISSNWSWDGVSPWTTTWIRFPSAYGERLWSVSTECQRTSKGVPSANLSAWTHVAPLPSYLSPVATRSRTPLSSDCRLTYSWPSPSERTRASSMYSAIPVSPRTLNWNCVAATGSVSNAYRVCRRRTLNPSIASPSYANAAPTIGSLCASSAASANDPVIPSGSPHLSGGSDRARSARSARRCSISALNLAWSARSWFARIASSSSLISVARFLCSSASSSASSASSGLSVRR